MRKKAVKGTIVSVNVSRKKGTIKHAVATAQVTPEGLEGDAHAGPWHRQVSLLASEDVAALSAECGQSFSPGEFAENLSTAGIDLSQVGPGDRLKIGRVELEITQIGKACHGSGCAIYQKAGKCVMPRRGVFARVLHGGVIRPGRRIEHVCPPLRLLIMTLSDRAFAGEYEDRSGPEVRACLETHFHGAKRELDIETKLLPDDATKLRAAIRRAVAGGADMIVTTGGTGIGPRDITPDVVRPMLDKEIPGIMEFIRVTYGKSKPNALLSRSVAGVIGRCLIYTLPGSVRAVREYLSEICKTLDHSLLMLRGIDAHG